MVPPFTKSVPAETNAALQLFAANVKAEAAPLGSPPLCVPEARTVTGLHAKDERMARQVSRTYACWNVVFGVMRLVAAERNPMNRS